MILLYNNALTFKPPTASEFVLYCQFYVESSLQTEEQWDTYNALNRIGVYVK